jgi:type IV secretion system protein VirD4
MSLRTLLSLSSSTLLASAVGTQVLAWQAHYAPVLGAPLTTVHAFAQTHGIYWPWQGWVWAWRWGWQAPGAMRWAGMVASLTFLLGTVVLSERRTRRSGPPPLTGHGTTQWATRQDMRDAGLHARTGLVLGKHRGHILRFDGPENVLLVGPQRQGKGVGVIIPSLLELQEHVVVLDVRGETWEATAGYRSTFSRCLRLSLTQPGSARFNLLEEVRKGTHHAFMDATTVAEMHVDPGANRTERRDYWDTTSKAFLTCAVLYEVHTRSRPTMAHLTSFWSQPGQSFREVLGYVVRQAPTPQIAELGQEVLNKTAREASSVLSTMMSQLFLYRDPTIAANTSRSDFRLSDFTHHQDWLSLYLVLSPGEEEHVRPFLRSVLRLALGRWMEMSDQKHRITLLMDEFTSYGTMQFFANHLAVLGGRGIRTLLAVQNVPQLTATYGRSDLITEQCKVRVYFAANGQTTGKEISQQTGTGTATTMQQSWRGNGCIAQGGRTHQAQQHARALLTEAEAMHIPSDTAVMQVAGSPPIWATKLRYWEHRVWRERSRIPAPGGTHGRP